MKNKTDLSIHLLYSGAFIPEEKVKSVKNQKDCFKEAQKKWAYF